MKSYFTATLVIALCWAGAGLADKIEIPPEAINMPKRGAASWCRQLKLRMEMQTNLNGEFIKHLNDGVVDFQDLTTEAINPAAGSFVCRGVVNTVSNKNYRGSFNVARNESGETIWWWVNDEELSGGKAGQQQVADGQLAPCGANSNDQTTFVAAIESGRGAYLSSQNDFQRGLTRSARAKQLCSIIGNRKISNWTAKVKSLSATSDGQGVLGLEFEGTRIEIRTALSQLTDLTEETFVRPNTSVFALMKHLQPGQCVRFSGEFQPSDRDCLREGSVTLKGSMLSPEFIFRFTDVELVVKP